MPLEGLEHVLSILHCGIERQLPRNYTGFRELDDIEGRPKTANCEWNAGKLRARILVVERRSRACRVRMRANGYWALTEDAKFERSDRYAAP